MANAKRDENKATVGLAVTDDSAKTVEPVKMDTSTKRILASINNESPPATSNPTGKRDGNRMPTMYGVTDDAAQNVVPIATDSNGYILVDLNIE